MSYQGTQGIDLFLGHIWCWWSRACFEHYVSLGQKECMFSKWRSINRIFESKGDLQTITEAQVYQRRMAIAHRTDENFLHESAGLPKGVPSSDLRVVRDG